MNVFYFFMFNGWIKTEFLFRLSGTTSREANCDFYKQTFQTLVSTNRSSLSDLLHVFVSAFGAHAGCFWPQVFLKRSWLLRVVELALRPFTKLKPILTV